MKYRRAPNGTGSHRIQVALPKDVLRKLLIDAHHEMRTLSAAAALIIARHYQQKERTQ